MVNIELRPYQQESVDAVIKYLMAEKGNPLILLPTGAGKGWIQAFICDYIRRNWPGRRVVMAVHNQELVSDTYKRATSILGEAATGVNCAGVSKRRAWHDDFVFGSVQSMAKGSDQLGVRDLLIVDEAHRVGDLDTANYGKLYTTLTENNPNLRVLGLTATGWRVGMGLLTEGPVFDQVVYDMTGIEGMNVMFDNGWLVRPITMRGEAAADTSALKKSSTGDFTKSSMEAAVSDRITEKALSEFALKAANRHAWLVFAISIEHGEKCVQYLRGIGVSAGLVHSKMKKAQRAAVLDDFRTGKLRAVVNVDMLTTGYDLPKIDALAMLRPTMSSSLWVQMVGRGLRPCEETGKINCLVMDFSANIERCGPINRPVIPLSPAQKEEVKKNPELAAEPVVQFRICDACGMYNEVDALACEMCATPLTKFTGEASQKSILASAGGEKRSGPQNGQYDVAVRSFSVKHYYDGTPYLRAVYRTNCGLNFVKDIQFSPREGQEYAPGGRNWWNKQSQGKLPPEDANVAIARTNELLPVVSIRVKQSDDGEWKITKEYNQ